MIFKSINDLLKHYGVKTWKETGGGLLAIHKWGMWWYYRFDDKKDGYIQTGSTQRFEF